MKKSYKNLPERALYQIDEMRYDIEMKEEADTFIKLGIAFSGKKIKVVSKL